MKGIITVVGKDKIGIISQVCTCLADNQVNILDISQTILHEYFNMMMIVDLSHVTGSFKNVVEQLNKIALQKEVIIKLQHEDIFNTMHRI